MTTPYDYNTLSYNPIVFYEVGDLEAGVLPDSSGNGRNATITGTVTTAAGPAGLEGAGVFAAGADYAESGVFTTAPLSTFTVETWFNTSAVGNNVVLLSGGSFTQVTLQGFNLILFTDNQVYFDWGNGVGRYRVFGGNITANTWHHVVGTFDGSTMVLYIDGVQVASATGLTGPMSWPTQQVGVAQAYSGIGGTLSPISIADGDVLPVALTSAQVSQRYYLGTQPATSPPYTTNLCPNPNFAVDLTGYTALPGTDMQLTPICFSGTQAMLIETDGTESGQGFVAPSGIVTEIGEGSVQLMMMGEGTFLVSVYVGPTSIVPLASIPVTLNSMYTWQNIAISNVSFLEGQEVFIGVATTFAQQAQLYVDCVQYESDGTPHPYIDGDHAFCTWSGARGNSPSFQQFQFPMGGQGGFTIASKTLVPIQVGESFTFGLKTAGTIQIQSNPSYVLSSVGTPPGSINDFSFYQLTDVDPAFSYVSYNLAGTSSGQSNYQRIYGVMYAPQQQTDSSGVLWNAAQYMATGYQLGSLPAGQIANVTDVQAELMPYLFGTAPTPSAYDTPRAVHTTVKPTRLNYCPNPSGAVNTNGYYLLGGASSITRDATNSSAVSGALDAWSIKTQINNGTVNNVTMTGSIGASRNWGVHLLNFSGSGGTQSTYQFGFNNPTGVNTFNIPANFGAQRVVAGDLIVVVLSCTTDEEGVTSVSDSKGNTYVPVSEQGNHNDIDTLCFVAQCGSALTSTDTITVHSTGGVGNWTAEAFGFHGFGTFIGSPVYNFGTSNAPTATYSNAPGGSIVVAIEYCDFSAPSGPGSWTTVQNGFGNNMFVWIGYKKTVTGDGVGISIPDLIVGDVYTVSAWVMTPSAGFLDVSMMCGGATGSSFQQGLGFGQGTFSGGPFGGVNTATDMTSNTWYNPVLTFVAGYSTVQLQFQPITDASTYTSPQSLYVDAICLEMGELARGYFDGSFGVPDYQWESGGTAGQTRSYYYDRYEAASGAVTTVLGQHTPLGINAAAPVYALPPTQ